MLVIYADDFKLAAHEKDIKMLWKGLRAKIKMDEPTPPDRFLGCYHEEFTATRKDVEDLLQNHPSLHTRESDTPLPLDMSNPKKPVRGFMYNMQKYCNSAVGKCCALADVKRESLKNVSTPFIDESQDPQGCPIAARKVKSKANCPNARHQY